MEKAIRRNMISTAEAHKIKVSDLKWYAAFHNTAHHPHVHLLVYSRDPRTGYLTNKGIESMRSAFARDLFRNEQYKLFQMETQQRDLLKQKVNKLLENMDVSREASPELVEGQVDSKLRQQINEKKVAQGLKISYTPVEDGEDEDEDEGFGLIL